MDRRKLGKTFLKIPPLFPSTYLDAYFGERKLEIQNRNVDIYSEKVSF